MAEQIPYGLVVNVLSRLGSKAFEGIAEIYGIKTEIERLKKTVEFIKAGLADAEQKQPKQKLIKLWIKELKQVFLEADDLFDELQTEDLLRKRDGKGKVRCHIFSSSSPIAFRFRIARKIKMIREQFNAIEKNMSALKLNSTDGVKGENENNWRETCSYVDLEDIIGREESKREIIDSLLNTNSDKKVSLVAIVGMGGLGKTTLAQIVYNDAEVKKVFKKQIWLCVSEEFDVKALVKKMLESLTGKEKSNQQLDWLQKKLCENLDGQRYLLVLDDVWNLTRQKWQELKKHLIYGAKGKDNKILVTTRNQDVAKSMEADKIHVLERLEDDQSWALLKRLAFEKDRIITEKFESIGQEIAKKCGGVPLAIRAMGNILGSKTNETEWEDILKGYFWELAEKDNNIMPILKLSYDYLPIELQQCFSYCSLYPKDWIYVKDDLIQLWMAQGYLVFQNEKQCLEDIGDHYVHVLLTRSFFQDVKKNKFGDIESFKMHDLMHDLSHSVACSDCWLYNEGRKIGESTMHVSFVENTDCALDFRHASRLRTILGASKLSLNIHPRLLKFKHLRSLDLSWCIEMKELPKSIGEMKHLRQLDLSNCYDLISLPKTIGNLVNLQTLNLHDCTNLEFSTEYLTKLISLRHLKIDGCKAFENGMPIGLDKLAVLQSLSNFIVGNDNDRGRNSAKLNELKELNLKNKLDIENLNLVQDVEGESKEINLKAKKCLKSLTLSWTYGEEVKNSDSFQLLENLCPHPNLKQLIVDFYPGVRFSSWLSSLTNLVSLQIFFCHDCQYLPALEGLNSLKTLKIVKMGALEYMCYEGCSSSVAAHTTNFFPSLEHLKLSSCENFRGWQREADVNNRIDNEKHYHSLPQFPRLLSLEINCCPNLNCMPTFPNLAERLCLRRCSMKPLIDTLKVSTTEELNPSLSKSCGEELNPSLSKLECLEIDEMDTEAIPEEWMRNLGALQLLQISDIPSLATLFRHMQHLPAALEEFTVSRIENLDSWSGDKNFSTQYQVLCCLHSLQKINIYYCEGSKALPEWICHLQSLRYIYISYCENLESLPEGMDRLTNLQTLQLVEVPLLKERCERGKGAEWPKIAHIPNIVADWCQI